MYAKYQRVLEPKHALRVLNELSPGGIKFVVHEKIGVGWIASVDVDGKTFVGNGPNLSKAKQQASEQVFKHIMMKKLAKLQSAESIVGDHTSRYFDKDETKKEKEMEVKIETTDREESEIPKSKRPKTVDKDETTKEKEMEVETDTTGIEEGEIPTSKNRETESTKDTFPWDCLISFALYKLFEEWYRDDDSFNVTLAENTFVSSLRIAVPFQTTSLTPFSGTSKPMKKIPEDANKCNPVMMLNQIKPNIEYKVTSKGYPQPTAFEVSVKVNGQEYIGRGRTKKAAKKMAAEAALAPLGIVFE